MVWEEERWRNEDEDAERRDEEQRWEERWRDEQEKAEEEKENRKQKQQTEGEGNADVFSLPPFISPRCHPDYISATC